MTLAQFYDIALKPPANESSCSPNPWKSRYALNFKEIVYSTVWVELPKVSAVRKSLGVPASRKFADGTDYYTLPVFVDESTGRKLGDSFDIATYLEETYPGPNKLFPVLKLDFKYEQENFTVPLSEIRTSLFEDYAQFNKEVDGAFQSHVLLMADGLPFDPATIVEVRAEFIRRANAKSWGDFKISGEARQRMLDSLKDMLEKLAELYTRDPSGPYILGSQASYADFIIGGWLKMMHGTLPEWSDVRTWHNNIFGDLYDALEVYADTK